MRKKEDLLSEGLTSFFLPYHPITWFVILVALLIQLGLVVLIARTEWWIGRRRDFHGTDLIWRMIRLQLSQSIELKFFR